MSFDQSYIEACVSALPLEKQAIARKAFVELSEDGTDSFVGRLVIILGATGAYAERIPKELKAVCETIRSDMAAERADRARLVEMLQKAAGASAGQPQQALPIAKLSEEVQAQNAKLQVLTHHVHALRQVRINRVLVMIIVTALATAAVMYGVFGEAYKNGQLALEYYQKNRR